MGENSTEIDVGFPMFSCFAFEIRGLACSFFGRILAKCLEMICQLEF